MTPAMPTLTYRHLRNEPGEFVFLLMLPFWGYVDLCHLLHFTSRSLLLIQLWYPGRKLRAEVFLLLLQYLSRFLNSCATDLMMPPGAASLAKVQISANHRVTFCCRIPFNFGINQELCGITTGLHQPMITSPMQLDVAQAVDASPSSAVEVHQDADVQGNDHLQEPQLNVSVSAFPSNDSPLSPAFPSVSLAEFRDLQSQTQQLSDQLDDFELAWTPRSSRSGDCADLEPFSDNESGWAYFLDKPK